MKKPRCYSSSVSFAFPHSRGEEQGRLVCVEFYRGNEKTRDSAGSNKLSPSSCCEFEFTLLGMAQVVFSVNNVVVVLIIV